LGTTWSNASVPSVCVPGASQKVVPGGLAAVRSCRLCVVLTAIAPAGAALGPDKALVFPQILAGGVFGALTGFTVDAAVPFAVGRRDVSPSTAVTTTARPASSVRPAAMSTPRLRYHGAPRPGDR